MSRNEPIKRRLSVGNKTGSNEKIILADEVHQDDLKNDVMINIAKGQLDKGYDEYKKSSLYSYDKNKRKSIDVNKIGKNKASSSEDESLDENDSMILRKVKSEPLYEKSKLFINVKKSKKKRKFKS
jgi:hypothetical protein